MAKPSLKTESKPVELPKITDIKRNAEGYHWQSYLVTLPKGLDARSLQENATSGIWSKVQTGPNALRRGDELRVLTADGQTLITAIVSGATKAAVHVAALKIHKFEVQSGVEFQSPDSRYSIRFAGSGYTITDNRSGCPALHEQFDSLELAKLKMAGLYPTKGAL